jgi:hypothetical protein
VPREHFGQCGSGKQHRRDQIELDQPAHLGRRRRRYGTVPVRTGIVHDNVNPSESRDRLTDQRAELPSVGQIGGNRKGIGAGGPDGLRLPLQLVGSPRCKNDRRSASGEFTRCGNPYAGAGPSDDCDLIDKGKISALGSAQPHRSA